MTTPVFRLLGHPEWAQAASRSSRPAGQVGRFLAYLAFRGEWLDREQLAFLFWPDQPDGVARRNLRKLLHRARQDAQSIEVDGDLVRWVVATDVQEWREALAGQDWEAAFALHRGPLLAGLERGATAEFSDWLEHEREAITRAWHEGLLSHAERLTGTSPGRAARLLRRLLDIDPFDEAVLQALLRCLAAAGNSQDLEPTYAAFARRLEEDLGLQPSAETSALLHALEEAAPSIPTTGVGRRAPSGRTYTWAPTLERSVFVGRDRELAWLTEHLDRAAAGQGGAVAVEGEAGVGKTRLVEAFLGLADRALGNQTPGNQTPENEASGNHAPGTEASANRGRGNEGSASRGLVFSGRCFERELVAPLEPVRAALSALLSDPTPDARVEAVRFWSAGPSDRSAVHREFTAKLARAAREAGGAVLFIDDVQWADSATLEFLSYAAKRVHTEPVLIVVTYRREDRGSLASWLEHLADRRALTVLTLGRLELAQTEAFVTGVADLPAESVSWLSAFVQRESEGNPFYLKEYLRWLRDKGVLELDASQRIVAVAREKLPATALPEGVRALISARYQALGEAARNALDLAAVIGRSFSLELLENSSGLDPSALWSALEPLLASGLIVENAGDSYAFSHDKLRQTVHDGIGPPPRRALHRRVAVALEALGADDAELAHHYLRAHAWPEAFLHLDLAARAALRNHAWEAALQGFGRALDIVDRLPDADRKRFTLLQEREKLLEYMERQSERATTVTQMAALAERLADPRLKAEAQLKRMALLMRNGRSAEGLEAQQQALRLFSELGDVTAEARVHRELAYAAWTTGDFQEQLAASAEALRLYQALGNRRAEAAISGNIAQAYRKLELQEQALDWAERAANIYRELGDELGEYLRLDTLAWVNTQRGDLEAARGPLEQLLTIAKALGDKHLVVEKHMNLGQVLLELDLPQQALEHFRAAAKVGAETGDPRHEGYPLMILGATLERLGEAGAAEQAYKAAALLLETAHAVSGLPDEQIGRADALTLLAGILEQDPQRSEQALSAFQDAEAVFARHREGSRLSKLLMARGSLYWRRGQAGLAAEDFERAADNARHAGAPAREAAALASLGVAYRDAGRLDDSVAATLGALERLRSLDDRQAEAYVWSSLASSYRALGKVAEARSSLEQSRKLRQDLGDAAGAAKVSGDLADLAARTLS